MRFLIRLEGGHIQGDLLEVVRGMAIELGIDARNPKWTSYGALELDVFAPSRADFDLFMAALAPLVGVEFTHDLNTTPRFRSEHELLSEAKELFDSERYWECHEVLEGVWRTKSGDERVLLQGMILVCAAFVHHQKGEDAVALGILERAVRTLRFSQPSYGAFRVDRMRTYSEEILRGRRFFSFEA
ncbi:MAG: DUF309 domain-containing protein [Nitrososphaerota archaeon]|nr:DUF309 domain-containing protein [Nitrososphaerota archaeon]MDG6917964.1 DUF309 domain-containing protein [Nitrososphaerota archaeon]